MKTLNAKIVINYLDDNRIEPDETHTAAHGVDWGQVKAWRMADDLYVIKYGDNGESNYDIAEDTDDLAAWMEQELDGIDGILQRANNRGITAVDVVVRDEPDTDTYYVLVTRDWLDGTESTSAATNDRGDVLDFACYDEANEWATTDADGDYCLAHNEAGRPTYTIVAL
jgi:hypothetical protein